MKDFEVRYPVEGASALKPESYAGRCGRVIDFPGTKDAEHEALRLNERGFDERLHASFRISRISLDDLRGVPFEQLSRTSELALGLLFTGVTALFVFLGA